MAKYACFLALICLLLAPTTAGAQVAPQPGAPDAVAAPAAPPSGVSDAAIMGDPNYRVAPDDVLQLTVWGEPSLQGIYLTVTPEGQIAAPVIGTLQASGRTVDDIRKEIASRFVELDYLRNPTVQLTLYQIHKMRVRVLGQVFRPGLQQMRDGDRLDHAVAEAGGFNPETAALAKASITRQGESEPIPVNLEAFYFDGDMAQNMELQDGDTIYIPEDTENKYYVMGFVRSPTQYPLKRTTTVTQAISQAGGTIDRGALGRTVIIRKGDGAQPEKIPVDVAKMLDTGDMSNDLLLQPGDVVFVPETKTPDLARVGQILNSLFNVAYLGRLGWW